MSEINVKSGTLVNGITIESHKAMQVKIAELTMENDRLKEDLEIEKRFNITVDSVGTVRIEKKLSPQPPRAFQVGDKVRIVANTRKDAHQFEIGEEGVIERVYGIGYQVRGKTDWWCNDTDLELISPADAVPDWIQAGKWVENKNNSAIGKIVSVKDGFIEIENKLFKVTMTVENALLYWHPFTPPPMPELPEGFNVGHQNGFLKFMGLHMPLECWIAAAEVYPPATPGSYSQIRNSLPALKSIRDWREKWGCDE